MHNNTGGRRGAFGNPLARRFEVEQDADSRWTQILHELAAVDAALYDAVASTSTPFLDGPLRRLSSAANNSRLWLAIAATIAVVGGRPGRRAALDGVVSIGVTSAAVNLGAKALTDRPRPDRDAANASRRRHVVMPASTSFPSGHAASAFAFAYAVSRHLPALAVPMRLLAGAVAYSRVHTGVHYPGDVAIGSIVGAGTAAMVTALSDRLVQQRQRRRIQTP